MMTKVVSIHFFVIILLSDFKTIKHWLYLAVTEGGAAAAAAKIEKATGNKNSRSLQNHRGQRKPKVIKIESFSNNTNETDNEENQGILPSASRETTPLDEQAAQTEYFDEKGFFSGNPFVEITKGIIHLYKQK